MTKKIKIKLKYNNLFKLLGTVMKEIIDQLKATQKEVRSKVPNEANQVPNKVGNTNARLIQQRPITVEDFITEQNHPANNSTIFFLLGERFHAEGDICN